MKCMIDWLSSLPRFIDLSASFYCSLWEGPTDTECAFKHTFVSSWEFPEYESDRACMCSSKKSSPFAAHTVVGEDVTACMQWSIHDCVDSWLIERLRYHNACVLFAECFNLFHSFRSQHEFTLSLMDPTHTRLQPMFPHLPIIYVSDLSIAKVGHTIESPCIYCTSFSPYFSFSNTLQQTHENQSNK